ncbi:hypothetical protein N7E81_13835 [Reichenbachiella carrageenanivorans]|uniref:Leucine-rich repeat (LRR) protein n=1 Tax=Reichenbachiella carrageenanivorans TaxID=2979869 RepID=A0ABY6D055_9BACT|nr:leucine-rich repeat domain-containing protein [Reichenbachiella carrageenanivorans]UXX78438.1 hypothetical protein N7E81_13835 [Reichenbachiella carrageenanivorans]
MKYFLLLALSLTYTLSQAQTAPDDSSIDEVRSLVNFYEYMLNTIGGNKTSTRDKEVIITESYKKVFKNQEVQIEDDLILDRKVITNKDVSAYLRDVDFFFNDIHFDFNNIEIERIEAEDGSYYYLVSFESTLQGTTLDDETLNSTKKRFLEVNHNEQTNDLKIVSVYSTKVSREKELQLWWESLSFGWVNIFKSLVPAEVIDSKTLMKIASLDSLNLAGNQFVLDLEPLSALKNLKQLDISDTKITDLSPLRYARHLNSLRSANTRLVDITTLEYFDQLVRLDLSNTGVTDISTLARLSKLKQLNLSGTAVTDFDALNALQALQNINLSNTAFDDPTFFANSTGLVAINLSRTPVDHLFVFQSLPQVQTLNLSETRIVNLNGLENHPMLSELLINQTKVSKLTPLAGLPHLKKIYADLSSVTEQIASEFMTQHPSVVVVTNSQQLTQWWWSLPANWKSVLGTQMGTNEPTKEDLAMLMNIDSLDVSDKKLYTSSPLQKFKRLRYLNVSRNDIGSFDFTSDMEDLEFLSGIDLPIASLDGLEANKKLKQLFLTNTKVKDIQPLNQLNQLELLDTEGTFVEESQVVSHLSTNPQTVIIYQSDSVLTWWNNLPPVWQKTFGLSNPSSFELHRLIEKQELEIVNKKIPSLAPLQAFINLKAIKLDRIQLTHLSELYMHEGLLKLTCTNGPLISLEGISKLTKLETLNISQTAIEDLKDLYEVRSLKHLDCSGTNIKSIKGVDDLMNLESLNVSNTRMWRLDRVFDKRNLKSLICYNTRLSQSKVDEFQTMYPDCEITFY